MVNGQKVLNSISRSRLNQKVEERTHHQGWGLGFEMGGGGGVDGSFYFEKMKKKDYNIIRRITLTLLQVSPTLSAGNKMLLK
jgi:hypothetical protein